MHGASESAHHFVVIREHGGAWDPTLSLREQEGWQEHAEFMEALVDDGFILLGGPVGDGPRVLLIIAAASTDEVRARLAADPWSPHLLALASVEPWTILLGPDTRG
jgi:hypothetical protein